MDRLLAIERVGQYRALQRWTRSPDLRQFERFNVIFGVNGTGKSTLASLLRELSVGIWTSGEIDATVGDDDHRRSVRDPRDVFWRSIRVFDSEYVTTNLRFGDEAGGSAEPLLVLGAQRIGVEEERAAATERLEAISTEIPSAHVREAEG